MRLDNETIAMIRREGGATLTSDLQNANLNKGYMVSLKGYETVVDLTQADTVDLTELVNTVTGLGAYLGAWIHGDNLYLDASINLDNKREAIKLAKKNDQLAIFDLNNLREIMTK